MPNLSPAAQAFVGSILRHLLTGLAGVLVAHGWVSPDVAHPYIEEGVGFALQGLVMLWANRTAYWQQIHAIIARTLPAHSTALDVQVKVDQLQQANALPSVFTPAHVVPTIAAILVLALALGLAPACATTTGLAPTTATAHVAVVSVDAIIKGERDAYRAGLIDVDHHELYVNGLLTLAQSERLLNDALRTWNANAGQPMPTIVADAIFSLGVIVADLQPLAGNSALAPLLATLNATIGTLKGQPR